MKKLSLLFAFSFVFLFSIYAQENKRDSSQDNNSFGRNWFVGAGVQGDVYINDDGGHRFGQVVKMPSLDGNVFVGKWFSHKVGARILAEGGSLHPFFQKESWMVHEKYIAGRLDFLLNLTNCFRSYSPDRFYNLIPYLGVGGGYAFNAVNRPDKADNFSSFLVGAGLWNTFRLSRHVALFVNLEANGVDAKFDGWKGKKDLTLTDSPNRFDYITSASLGFVYNFGCKKAKEIVAPPVVREEPAPAPKPEPRPEPKPQPQPKPEPPKVVEPVKPALDDVFFRLDKDVIDSDQQIKVKQAAEFLNTHPNAKLSVVGYADVQTGNPRYNLDLSKRRTKRVANELVTKYKIDSSRLKLDWKGDTVQPFKVNEKNRVVMFTE
jgi:outer membrane protein OmpA-like peptidoglycan-associated protein